MVIAAADQGASISFLPRGIAYPTLVLTSLPNGTLIALAPPALVSAIAGGPQIYSARDAVVHMESGSATNIFDETHVIIFDETHVIQARPVHSFF